MRWIVGVDLLELSHGAIRFAAWVHGQEPGEELVGVHCLGAHKTRPDQSEADFRDWIQGLARRAVAELGVLDAFKAIQVVDADSPEEGLAGALRREDGDVLVLGRRARRGEDTVVHLGRVARRLLRSSELPVAIVPPDLPGLPPGPVVVATDMRASSHSALSFARALATKLRRELIVLHAVGLDSSMHAYLAEAEWDEAQQEALREAHAALRAHVDAAGLKARTEVVGGAVTFAILSACERVRACALVCGSRRLSFVEKLFSSSVGSELAAHASIPVIVVPPAAK